MSYMKKCLAIDPGLRCKRIRIKNCGGRPTGYAAYVVNYGYMHSWRTLATGLSAASAWKNAWERLREVPG